MTLRDWLVQGVVLAAFVACGADGGETAGGSGAGGSGGSGTSGTGVTGGTTGGTTTSQGGTSSSSGTAGGGGGPDVPHVPVCQTACKVAADCSIGQPAYDEDNYSCEPEGYCRYTGCNSDAECQALGDFTCVALDGGLKVCQAACQTVKDCSLGQLPYDEDNYSCEPEGYCKYTGCNSDAECEAVGDLKCVDEGFGAYCQWACDTVADCDFESAPNDTDNYSCEPKGYCKYTGCNSDVECATLGNYVCR